MNMQWNLEQLRLFVSVAELRSFSAVARQQRKAQSAISSAIALLEEDLGVSLFERSSGRQPKLTEAGSALLQEAREILRQCDRLNGRPHVGSIKPNVACLINGLDVALAVNQVDHPALPPP